MAIGSSVERDTRARFERDGYVVREHLLSAGEAAEAARALSGLIREMHAAARAHAPSVSMGRDEAETRSNYAGVELARKDTRLVVRFEAGVDPSAVDIEEADRAVRVL